VESIADVDVHNGFVYFSGNYSNPTERHLWRVNLHTNEGGVQRMTTHSNGWHDTTVAGARGYFADVYSNTEGPITFVVHAFDPVTGLIQQTYPIFDANVDDARVRAKRSVVDALRPPQIHILRSGDPSPQVDLYCAVYMPPGYNLADYEQQQALSGTQHTLPRFPAIMSVYGGPHVMRVQNQWLLTADLRAQRMAQQGIVVIKCDNRGSYRRGLAFEGAIKHDMGHVEVLDQVAAVEYFTRLGLVDPRRVGMFGWSYGGYMSAMSLCRAPSVFTCAVAGAPVTSWDGYDTHYTERYMGHPDVNVDGYRRSSVMEHVSHLTGHLMLVHGLIDENVHFRHTARLINELIAARKRYELILFPCERHAPHKMQDKVYLEDLMTEFFLKHLRPTPLAELATTTTTTTSAAAAAAAAGAGAGAVVDGGANEALGSGAVGASATLTSKGGRAAL
jgi:dipeptidyl-peptidase-4